MLVLGARLEDQMSFLKHNKKGFITDPLEELILDDLIDDQTDSDRVLDAID